MTLFAHDTELALAALVALVNSDPDSAGSDPLADLEALDAYLTRWEWSGSRSRDAAELTAVRALRERLLPLWTSPEQDVVDLVNAVLREAGALPQLVRHDEWDYHVHATTAQAPLAERMAVEFAMAMVDVVRGKHLDRLRRCAAADCGNVLVDLSKNRSRRFCDATCANRVNVAAFRARRSAGGSAGGVR
jgi:predicted RNA-binding Zn ribbon-like protein